MSDDTYREIAARLIEYGRKRAEVEAVDRDQLVWAAHKAEMPKREIAKLTGLSWATVDRTVREMEAKEG
jgi:hypothetical protein